MAFDQLLGNETLKQRLCASLEKDRSSHSYLISGPEGSGKHTLATLLAAALQCSQPQRPCGHCPQCRKVLNGVHPDVITVDDPEKKTVSVKLVREACADLFIRPNEGRKKIYLFPRAQDMMAAGQNALLKCIEEPPSYGVFLFLAEHSEQLLTTIRSRCVELRLSPLPQGLLRSTLRSRFPQAEESAVSAAILRSGGYLGQAMSLLAENADLYPQTLAFAAAYSGGDPAALLAVLSPMEKLKRDQLCPILQQWQQLISSALSTRSGLPPVHPACAKMAANRSTASLLRGADAIKEALRLAEANVGPAHICGALTILLR